MEKRFTRKGYVTPQLFSLQHQPHMFVKIMDAATRLKAGALAKSEDGSLPVVAVTNLETGEVGLLIMPTVLEQRMADGEVTVGGCYEIEDRGIKAGKNYRDIRVWEIGD